MIVFDTFPLIDKNYVQEGVLWKITHGNHPPSYIQGIILTQQPRITHIDSSLNSALKKVLNQVSWVLTDHAFPMTYSPRWVFSPPLFGDKCCTPEVLGSDIYERLVIFLEQHGFSISQQPPPFRNTYVINPAYILSREMYSLLFTLLCAKRFTHSFESKIVEYATALGKKHSNFEHSKVYLRPLLEEIPTFTEAIIELLKSCETNSFNLKETESKAFQETLWLRGEFTELLNYPSLASPVANDQKQMIKKNKQIFQTVNVRLERQSMLLVVDILQLNHLLTLFKSKGYSIECADPKILQATQNFTPLLEHHQSPKVPVPSEELASRTKKLKNRNETTSLRAIKQQY